MNANEEASTSIKSAFMDVFDDSKPSKTELFQFMNRFALAATDKTSAANFISMSPAYRKRFNVPAPDVPSMMKLLNICSGDGITNHFYELQDVNQSIDDNGDLIPGTSGLFFEFHFKTVDELIDFDSIVPTFIRVLFDEILSNHIEFPDSQEETHYCFFLKSKPVYDTPTMQYHARFRVAIPTIMLDAETRFFIYRRVWRNKKINIQFERRLRYHLHMCLLQQMRTAPVSLLGSGHPDELESLAFKHAFKVTTVNGACAYDAITLGADSFPSLINDMSVNYLSSGSVVTKTEYSLSEASFQKMESEMNDAQQFRMAYDEAYSTYLQQLVYDDDIPHIYAMTKMLSDARFETLDACLEIIKALAAESERYHCVAVMTIKDRNHLICDADGAKDPISWEDFQNYWDEAIHSSGRSQYSANAIQYWAISDAPSGVERYTNAMVRAMMIRDIRHPLVRGRINHSQIASYLHFMFKNIYATQSVTKSQAEWYEFVTPKTKDIEPGQVYKWRKIGVQPDSLAIYMTTEFKDIATAIYTDMNSLCVKSDDSQKPDARMKYIMDLSNQYFRAIHMIFNNGSKRSVIDEATSLFKKNYFIKQLDRTPHIIGVGNGVLEFSGPDVRLLDYYHTYPISLFTDTNYVSYDEDSEYVQTMYRVLRSMFPDDEMDAMDFLLYYLSTSLDWLTKESLFLIIHGGGCHALNTPIRMFDGSIKLVQDVRVGDQLMGDDNTKRTVQELFRGNDEMVRILPAKGESFEVNKDHVLSLKFANDACVHKRMDETYPKYHAEWYVRNGAGEPSKKSKTCDTLVAAYDHLAKIHMTEPAVIQKGDIIDIKVKDLMKWSPCWLQKSYLTLYKSDETMDPFAMKEIGVGDYYGFELDGNHRYLTGDYYVHHNSNGKSVLMDLFQRTLGNLYVRKMPLSFITEQARTSAASADPSVMELKDARLVYYSESSRSEKVNVAKVKEITGGETLSGRQLYKEQENFSANCNHIVTTNHRFVIETTEHAVWRRFISYKFKIRFNVVCDPNEPNERPRDPDLINKIKEDKRYQEAFLSILIHYRSKLYSLYGGHIFRVPHPTIKRETEEYRQEEDIYQRYIMNHVYFVKGVAQPLEDLVTNFREYYRSQGSGQYTGKSEDLIHIFRNSILANEIKAVLGKYVMFDYVSFSADTRDREGAIVYHEWLKQSKSAAQESCEH